MCNFHEEVELLKFVLSGGDEVLIVSLEALWSDSKAWLEAWSHWVGVGEGGDEEESKLSIKA